MYQKYDTIQTGSKALYVVVVFGMISLCKSLKANIEAQKYLYLSFVEKHYYDIAS